MADFYLGAPRQRHIARHFAGIWGNRVLRTLAVSFLVWMAALALFLTLPMQNAWLVFVVAAPLQVLAIFWFFLRAQKAKIK